MCLGTVLDELNDGPQGWQLLKQVGHVEGSHDGMGWNWTKDLPFSKVSKNSFSLRSRFVLVVVLLQLLCVSFSITETLGTQKGWIDDQELHVPPFIRVGTKKASVGITQGDQEIACCRKYRRFVGC